MSRTKGLNTKIHLAVDAHGMPVRFFITSDTTADCTVAARLIEGFRQGYLLADRGYDTDAIILQAMEQDMIPVIPSKKNRKQLREYDEYLYKIRHLVENAFLLLKDGAILRRATLKILLLSSPPSKSVVLPFGCSFIDDTI